MAAQMVHMTVEVFTNRCQEQTLWVVAALITSIRFVESET
jgi:hypothetical protein